MRDLTKGSVAGHVLHLSAFIAMTTLFQTLYLVVDLYFVGRLGKEAVAGVALSGNIMMVVLALTQSLGVGATAFIAQALGRRDREHAETVFNQTMVLSTVVGLAFGVVTWLGRGAYSRSLAADAMTAQHSVAYLTWYIPAMALQFPLVGMGSALRGSGDMKVPTALQIGTVLLNIVLAPILMFGWGTGVALGVAGASLASLLAILAGCVAFFTYFARPASPLKVRPRAWRPHVRLWGRMLKVGVPAGGEFALISVYMVLVYAVAKPFGAAAQAGFGIGMRVMQALFLPAVAIGFATAPVAAQNFGARLSDRVRQTFTAAVRIGFGIMAANTVICQVWAPALVAFFNPDAAVVAFGTEYLRLVSWTFVASSTIFVASSTFQGMGHTLPPLASSMLRLVLFALPVFWLSQQPWFEARHIWYLSIGSIVVHAGASLWLLQREFRSRLVFEPPVAESARESA
jgi:putative MATE family efflux protein